MYNASYCYSLLRKIFDILINFVVAAHASWVLAGARFGFNRNGREMALVKKRLSLRWSSRQQDQFFVLEHWML